MICLVQSTIDPVVVVAVGHIERKEREDGEVGLAIEWMISPVCLYCTLRTLYVCRRSGNSIAGDKPDWPITWPVLSSLGEISARLEWLNDFFMMLIRRFWHRGPSRYGPSLLEFPCEYGSNNWNSAKPAMKRTRLVNQPWVDLIWYRNLTWLVLESISGLIMHYTQCAMNAH